MGFYQQIAKYYDYIFPVGTEQLEFIKKAAGSPPAIILDVACGTGGYAVTLAKAGYRVSASDIDDQMVRQTQQKAWDGGAELQVEKVDMRLLTSVFKDKYDCIYCIGNSIVHLGSEEEIYTAITQMYELLDDNGRLILQIINYDRIMAKGLTGIPAITDKDAGIVFERRYNYIRDAGLISFETTLTVEKQGEKEVLNNSVELLPLLSIDMKQLIDRAGFRDIRLYGDFSGSEYNNEESYMFVVEARK